MSSSDSNVLKINGQVYKFNKKAFELIEEYFDKLEKEYKGNEDIIDGYKERISDQLYIKRDEVVDENDVKDVIAKLGDFETVKTEIPKEEFRPTFKSVGKIFLHILGYILFWLPHTFWIISICGISFMFFGAVMSGPEDLTLSNILTYAGFLLLPTISSIIGLYLTFKRRLKTLLLFLFAIEIPIFLLSLFRMTVLSIVSPVINFGYLLILIACATLIIDEIEMRFIKRIKWLEYFKTIGYSIGSFMSGYVLLIWLFFFPLFVMFFFEGLYSLFNELFNFNPYNGGGTPYMFISVLYLPLFLIALVFYFSPVYVFPIYSGRLIKKIIGKIGFKDKKIKLVDFNIKKVIANSVISISTVVVILTGIILLANRFNNNVKNKLDELNNKSFSSFEEEETFMNEIYKHENKYLSEVKNRYFARFGYLFDDNSYDLLENIYNYRYEDNNPVFAGIKYSMSQLNEVFYFVISPIVYKGDLNNDFENSADEYKKIFDENIQKAESKEIKNHLSNTFADGVFMGRSGSDEAGLIDENKASVTISDLDIASDINFNNGTQKTQYTLTFRNKEMVNEEIVLEFSLPQDNIITGMKLGPELQHNGQVAPKGAAAETYERSLFYSIDPSLLEQIGPRTYRLRVYPIPPVDGSGNPLNIELPGYQKVMFEYSGKISTYLPGFSYSKNLNKDGRTNFSLGIKTEGTITPSWMTSNFAGMYKDKQSRISTKIVTSEELNIFEYKPEACEIDANEIKLFVDISKSAKENKPSYLKFINTLEELGVNKVDLYVFNHDSKSLGNDLNINQVKNILSNMAFWGYTDKSKVVEDFMSSSNKAETTYILSDSSDFEFTTEVNYELDYTQNQNNIVYLVQTGERLSAQKEEITNLVLVSGGTSILFDNKTDLFEGLCRKELPWDQSEIGRKLNSYKNNLSNMSLISDGNSRLEYAKTNYSTAKYNSFVDPLNSMIAIETLWQQNTLDDLSNNDNAFDQEFDTGEQNLTVPNMMMGQSMPEAGGITLLILALTLGLTVVYLERKRA